MINGELMLFRWVLMIGVFGENVEDVMEVSKVVLVEEKEEADWLPPLSLV